MSPPENTPYDVVLADLRARRDQLTQAIDVIETVRSSGVSGPLVPVFGQAAALSITDAEADAGAFLGMSIPEATKKLLLARKRTISNAELAVALKAGGLALTSADPMNTIGSVLMRRFNTSGDIVRVSRGVWGLKEWYPNRNFRTRVVTATDTVFSEVLKPDASEVSEINTSQSEETDGSELA